MRTFKRDLIIETIDSSKIFLGRTEGRGEQTRRIERRERVILWIDLIQFMRCFGGSDQQVGCVSLCWGGRLILSN